MLQILKNIFTYFLNFLFPPREDELIVSEIDYTKIECHIKNEEIYENINTIFSYKNKYIKSLIWEIKYHRNIKAINFISQILFENIKADLEDKILFENTKYLLINIPITTKKLKEKGFCHTQMICEKLIEFFRKDNVLKEKVFYLPNILIKTKETKSQSHSKNKNERLSNLKDCFKINNDKIDNKYHIIIIDDVVTTGATINQAFKVFNYSGFKKINAYTIAH